VCAQTHTTTIFIADKFRAAISIDDSQSESPGRKPSVLFQATSRRLAGAFALN
jgi:hypothetical protein